MSYSNKYDVIFQYIYMMPYLFVARARARSLCVHPNFQATTRATSDNFVACRSHRLRACVRQIGMASYIYWNMTSYLLEYDIIFIGIWHHIIYIGIWSHIYWNVASYLLFIGIWHHINCNMLSYLLEYIIIYSRIYYHIY